MITAMAIILKTIIRRTITPILRIATIILRTVIILNQKTATILGLTSTTRMRTVIILMIAITTMMTATTITTTGMMAKSTQKTQKTVITMLQRTITKDTTNSQETLKVTPLITNPVITCKSKLPNSSTTTSLMRHRRQRQ